MINPAQTIFYAPPEIMSQVNKPKQRLFERIARHIEAAGGDSTQQVAVLDKATDSGKIPIVGCSIQLRDLLFKWRNQGKPYIYWDRGYARRVYATWLPRGEDGGYYRWHLNSYQMQEIRNVPADRWTALNTSVLAWRKQGKHILVAKPSKTYAAFHGLTDWTDRTIYELSLLTRRQIVVRDKESKRSLAEDLDGAHAMVTHGSNAAVEAVIMGCPVFVDTSSAARLVGCCDLNNIETPIYPDRTAWLNSLAYCQFNEKELVDGTLWKLMR